MDIINIPTEVVWTYFSGCIVSGILWIGLCYACYLEDLENNDKKKLSIKEYGILELCIAILFSWLGVFVIVSGFIASALGRNY